MKLPRRTGGYTIVEVMIVLAISSALFATAISGFSRQNNRTEFNQAIRDVELKIQDALNDIGTGYYPNSGNFTCQRTSSPAYPAITSTPSGQGTNQDCIFIGKAFDLLNPGVPTYSIHTIIGLRNEASDPTVLASTLEGSANRTIAGIGGAVDITNYNGSIRITKVLIGDGSVDAPSNGFAVVSGFGGGAIGGSGATTNQVSIASIDPTYNFGSTTTLAVRTSDLNKTMTICIEESGGGAGARHATITIGAGSQINIESNVDNWPAGCVA